MFSKSQLAALFNLKKKMTIEPGENSMYTTSQLFRKSLGNAFGL